MTATRSCSTHAMRRVRVRARLAAMLALGSFAAACAPRLAPLAGAPAPAARVPAARLAPGHRHLVFRWEASDPEMLVRGEGAARIAPPDSARLDFFLAGGLGGGRAVLLGDTLSAPGGPMVDRLVPPAPLLWAALGRLAVPPVADTVVAVEGELLRADLGSPVQWRVTFRGDSLVRIEHVVDGRVTEWVDRSSDRVRYRHETSRRELQLTITRSQPSAPFDASIWRP